MNIYIAFTLFALIILVYWFITELFTIFFRFTGLQDEKARFQVISILTGCGFTTQESETVLNNRIRRNLARVTMLFGYVFNITIVSSLVNIFLSMKQTQFKNSVIGLTIPMVVITFIMIFLKVPAVRVKIDVGLEKFAHRIIKNDGRNTIMLLDHIGDEAIAVVKINEVPEQYVDVPLLHSRIKEDLDLLVLATEPEGGTAEPASGRTVFHVGDKVTMYGDYETIAKAFNARERFTE